jgi:hypothetical protein
MAEVAGLILGAVGVAGVIGAFKDTIDLFNLIADSHHLGHDHEILDIKFDIEKTLLLQWADRVKLLRPDYDKRLDSSDTQTLINRTLGGIGLLLSDTSELQQRYGLVEAPEVGFVTVNRLDLQPRISDARMQKIMNEFKDLKLRVDGRQKAASFSRKVRWVVSGKQKFKVLIQQLGHLIAKLNQLLPASNDYADMQLMADEDLESIRGLGKLKSLLEASVGFQDDIAESTRRALTRTLNEHILAKLWYRKLNDRRESIEKAHGDTMHWVLKPLEGNLPWDDLSSWLQFESGIYWVCGKTGSGKSALMKYRRNS